MTLWEEFWSLVALIVFGTLAIRALLEHPWALGIAIGIAIYAGIGMLIIKNEEEERRRGTETDRGQIHR